jgi:hypothetical protein
MKTNIMIKKSIVILKKKKKSSLTYDVAAPLYDNTQHY